MKIIAKLSTNIPSTPVRWLVAATGFALASLLDLGVLVTLARASDHLDSPATVANPQADISDVYAWVSPEGRRLNLAMTVQGHSFSNKIDYVLHVDSGHAFGQTTASTSITCHFAAADSVKCDLGNVDSAAGDPRVTTGLEGRHHKFRVFAEIGRAHV